MLHLPLQTVKYISDEFEKKLQGYSVKSYFLNEFEKVIVIEDSLVLYIGILESEMPICLNADIVFEDRKDNPFLGIPKNGEVYYELAIEELSYNTLGWKYNHTKFVKDMGDIIGLDGVGCDVHYTRFKGYARPYWCPEKPTLIEEIEEQIPELNLRERYELWEGILYYFIILEVRNANGDIDYGVAYTSQKPTSYVHSKCNVWIKKGFQAGDIRMKGQNFINALESWKGVKR